MIRIILYRLDKTGEWTEGVLHTFHGTNAVVENKATGEMELVHVCKEQLKFRVLTEDWVKMQVEAQRQAQQQGVLAGPIPRDIIRR